jgi:hypothetical protein
MMLILKSHWNACDRWRKSLSAKAVPDPLGTAGFDLRARVDCASIRSMKILKLKSFPAVRFIGGLVITTALLASLPQRIPAASWSGIQPLKSRRADVERVLGKPVNQESVEEGTLHFNVAGGTVTVSFVSAKFVANKKLRPEVEGTVLQIVLQHEHSSDTPDSMSLTKNRDFDPQDDRDISIYRNLKDGIVYTFISGKLKTSRYSASAEEMVRARK